MEHKKPLHVADIMTTTYIYIYIYIHIYIYIYINIYIYIYTYIKYVEEASFVKILLIIKLVYINPAMESVRLQLRLE